MINFFNRSFNTHFVCYIFPICLCSICRWTSSGHCCWML